jgi:UDP-N-acetyl-D-galactosamine dehydrogenase
MLKNRIQVEGARVLVMGLTFKENCPDLRNTKVVDIVSELCEYGINVDITDPWCSSEEAKKEYGLSLNQKPSNGAYDAIILAVSHDEFKAMGVEAIRQLGRDNHVLYDLKYVLPKESVDMRL